VYITRKAATNAKAQTATSVSLLVVLLNGMSMLRDASTRVVLVWWVVATSGAGWI
jgi:hypothetical protein